MGSLVRGKYDWPIGWAILILGWVLGGSRTIVYLVTLLSAISPDLGTLARSRSPSHRSQRNGIIAIYFLRCGVLRLLSISWVGAISLQKHSRGGLWVLFFFDDVNR